VFTPQLVFGPYLLARDPRNPLGIGCDRAGAFRVGVALARYGIEICAPVFQSLSLCQSCASSLYSCSTCVTLLLFWRISAGHSVMVLPVLGLEYVPAPRYALAQRLPASYVVFFRSFVGKKLKPKQKKRSSAGEVL